MRMILISGILILSVISLKSQTPKIKEETQYDSKSPEFNTIQKTFSLLSEEVDKIYNKDTARIELYLQIDRDGIIERVPNFNQIADSYHASYNLIRNKLEQIIYIAEYPASESGDWDLIYESYFDTNENLVAFIRKCSFFNGECAEIVHEKSEYYFDSKHNLIKKTYEITDRDKKPLDFKKCVFYYRFDYKKYTTLTEYLNSHKFKNNGAQ